MRDLEEEQRKLEINYDKILQNIFEKRNKKIQEAKSYPDFWLRVLSNHSVTKDFINEEDKSVLKYLKDIRYIKSDIDNVIILFLFLFLF
jgi:hypothetical protein